MKKQKNQEKQEKQSAKAQCCQRPGIWKILAIGVIVLFAVFIIGGLIKAHHIRSSFKKPTQEQIDYATQIATEKLQALGGNVSAFQIQVGKGMRRMPDEENNRTIIQVSFENKDTMHLFLVDVNSGELLLHSQTDIYVTLNQRDDKRHFEQPMAPEEDYPRFSKERSH